MIWNGLARAACVAVVAGGLVACSGGEGPASVAERFWTAARDRDEATLRATSIESESASLKLDGDAGVGEVQVGAAEVEGDEATVETQLTAETGERSIDLSFETVLVKRDGEWLVDLDETSSRMMKSLLGASMEELGEAMAEGMKEAMQGMAEGMTEAMQGMAEGMAEAMESVEEGSGSGSPPRERD